MAKATQPVKQTSAGTVPFSVRLTKTQRADLMEEAKKCGYSGSQFAEYAVFAVIDMIRTPPGSPVKMPKIVAIARYIRDAKMDSIETAPARK
jgi:hypothetical protein